MTSMDTSPELIGSGLVLESPGHGPQFCLGAILLSLPPQGGGPEIPNWDWAAVTGHTRLNGTTWGSYTLVGTYDGRAFTMTRPPSSRAEPEALAPIDPDHDPLRTPCPVPLGGWRVLDPVRTTDESMERTLDAARGLAGYAGAWVDQSVNPAARRSDEDSALLMNDPEKLIINVAVTGDTAAAEAELREIWGGALCVSSARHTEGELRRVLDEVTGTPGALGAGCGHDRVDLEVIQDDGSLQRELDDRFGPGLVVVTSALRPYPG
jgi:hypothetical protein